MVSAAPTICCCGPFPPRVLGSRIETHIERRKGFVITTDYVGPDRRKDDNRPSNVELFDPPNSLKMKAKDKLPSDVIARRLDYRTEKRARAFDQREARRNSFQVCILWRLIQDAATVAGQTSPDLIKLQGLAKSIETRSTDTEFQPAVEWCQSVLAAAEGLALGVDRNASMHLLGHAALSLHQVFHPEKTPADQLSEIDATVALIRARNQAQALAS